MMADTTGQCLDFSPSGLSSPRRLTRLPYLSSDVSSPVLGPPLSVSYHAPPANYIYTRLITGQMTRSLSSPPHLVIPPFMRSGC